MTVASQEASMLFDLLQTLDGDSLATLTPTFLTKAETLIADPWAMSAIPDFIYPETIGEYPQVGRIASISKAHWVDWPSMMSTSMKCL
jgi:hypothetical protein